MLIGELSQRTGVHAHQLRYYETQGLLQPGRGPNGYRHYTDDAILKVTQIRRLLGAGLSTEEIEYLLPCATGDGPDLVPCPDLLTALETRLQDLTTQIETLTHSHQTLTTYITTTKQNLTHPYHPCAPEPSR